VTRRKPWKLPNAPSSKPGVEPIANTNRIVPAVVGEARDKRKRVRLPTRSPFTSIQSLPLSLSLESTAGSLAVQHSEPVVAARSLAPRRHSSADSTKRHE
jgi:hypothetical protein